MATTLPKNYQHLEQAQNKSYFALCNAQTQKSQSFPILVTIYYAQKYSFLSMKPESDTFESNSILVSFLSSLGFHVTS
jgi:hypothetical protein